MDVSLKGKIALVTGASRGIGRRTGAVSPGRQETSLGYAASAVESQRGNGSKVPDTNHRDAPAKSVGVKALRKASAA
jgi:hypothetical protein